MAYGLTPDGFVKKRLLEVKAAIEQELAATFGPIRTDPASVFGGLIGPFSKQVADIWELIEELYLSQTVMGSGLSLDNILQLVGLTRLPATQSIVVAACYGTQGTVIPATSATRVDNTEYIFRSNANVTIDIANTLQCTLEITATGSPAYTVRINGVDFTSTSAGTIEDVAADLVALINAAITGSEVMTATDILDGTFSLKATDLETGYPIVIVAGSISISEFGSPITFLAESTGPIAVPGPAIGIPGALTIIETPVSGWDRVENLQPATLGRTAETDGEARIRRSVSLQSGGNASIEAIRSKVLGDVANVTGCSIFENDSDIIDIYGRPPHSFEAVVTGGDVLDIAAKLLEVKAAGIQTTGNINGGVGYTVLDSQGIGHIIKFSRPIPYLVYARITLTKYSEEEFPVTGATQVAENFVAYGTDNLPLGKDMIVQKFLASIFAVPGIATAVIEWAVTLEAAPPPVYPADYTSANITIAAAAIATFDVARVTVIEL